MSVEPVLQLVDDPAPEAPALRSSPSLPHDVPAAQPVAAYLEGLLARHAGLSDGEVATYIPELGDADPALFGISLVTCDGALYEVGDSRAPFTIQSISKPLTYGLALDEQDLLE